MTLVIILAGFVLCLAYGIKETIEHWSDKDHVRVDEVTEYLMYAMSVSEMQQAAKQHIQHDLYTMARSDFQKVYYDTIGVHKK